VLLNGMMGDLINYRSDRHRMSAHVSNQDRKPWHLRHVVADGAAVIWHLRSVKKDGGVQHELSSIA
jgi:hypothetical protein